VRYIEGKGIRLFKTELKALLEFVNPADEKLSFVNFKITKTKLKAWCSDGAAFLVATAETWDGAGGVSHDEYEWQIHCSALAMVMKAMGGKDVATLRVSSRGTIKDVMISDFDTETQLGMFNIPNDSIGTQLGLELGTRILDEAIRAHQHAATTWAMSSSMLASVAIVADAVKSPTVRVYAPADELSPTGVVIADGAWQLVISPCRDDETQEKGGKTGVQEAVDRFEHATRDADVSVEHDNKVTPLSTKARKRVATESKSDTKTSKGKKAKESPKPVEDSLVIGDDDSDTDEDPPVGFVDAEDEVLNDRSPED
jgi:hypothetical protein